MMILHTIFLLLTWLLACSGLRILAVLPFPMKSHQLMFNSLLAELVKRGHHVTVYSNSALKTNATNYKHISIFTSVEDSLDKKYSFKNIKSRLDMESFIRPNGFQILLRNLSEEVLSLPQIKNLLSSNEHFDVVILETFFSQEAFVGFGYKFNAPIVTLATFGSFAIIDSLMGNPNPLAYFSTYLLPYTSELTFYQRLKNLIASLSELYFSYYSHLPHQQAVMEKHFQGYVANPLPSIVDLLSNISVVLLNTQPEVSYARAWVPNMIPVGGLHIQENRTPLPKAIQEFIGEANEGFIYFSLGSTFSGATLPRFMKEAFVTAFKSIPQRVIWKIDVPPEDLPPNVVAVEWAPQASILAHPNCRGFVTHGGMLSLLEAVYFGVPLVGIPVFGDQPWNVAKVAHAEIGVALRVLGVSADSVYQAITQIVYNDKFKRNMKRLSSEMRDKPVSPLDSAAFWVEYVARHQGAPSLQSPGRKLSVFQNLFIDIILLITSAVLTVLAIFYFLLKKALRLPLSYINANKVKNE